MKFKAISMLFISTLIISTFSCKKDQLISIDEEEVIVDHPDTSDITERHQPHLNKTLTIINVISDNGEDLGEVWVEENGNSYIYEGDILIPKKTTRDAGVPAYNFFGITNRWIGGEIPYTIESGHPSAGKIQTAVERMNDQSVLCLRPRTNQRDYIRFKLVDSGCASYVGKRGGKQDIEISTNCSRKNTILIKSKQ
jgi:hypothetical protein